MAAKIRNFYPSLVTLALTLFVASAQQLTPAGKDLLDTPLEGLLEYRVDTVVGASRYEQKINEAPSSVSIVTSEDIRMFGYRTLAEALRGVRGVYVNYDRTYDFVGLRGFSRLGDTTTRVLLLVDGHRMNDSLYDAAAIGQEALLDIDMIERIEVIRGPSSSIYGNNAVLGVLNVVSRRGKDINGLETSAELGALDTRKARLTYGKLFTNGVDLVLSASVRDSDGNDRLSYREFKDTNRGWAVDSDDDYSHQFFARAGYHDFTLSAGYSLREKEVPTASYHTVFNDGRQKITDERMFADLKWERDIEDDLRTSARVYFDHYGYRAEYPLDLGLTNPPVLLPKDDNVGQNVGAELQLTKKLFDRHTLVAGTAFRDDFRLDQVGGSDHPHIQFYDIRKDRWSVGVYGQGEVVILTNLLLNAGVRYDRYSSFGDSVNPRAGLIYGAWKEGTFKLLYGQAFRAPTAYELFLDSPGFAQPNPDLQPETIRTYEMVYEQGLPRHMQFSLSGYRWEFEDLINQTYDTTTGEATYRNISSAVGHGVEVELEGRYAHGLRWRGSYALQRAEDDESGKELSNSPRHLAQFQLVVPFYREKVFGSIEVQYLGGWHTRSGDQLDDFAVVNATLFSRELVKNLEVSATIYNLFDTQYENPVSSALVQDSVRQDGRGFRVKATYKF